MNKVNPGLYKASVGSPTHKHRLDIVNIAYQDFYSIKAKDLKTIAEFKRQKTIRFLLHYER